MDWSEKFRNIRIDKKKQTNMTNIQINIETLNKEKRLITKEKTTIQMSIRLKYCGSKT